MAQDATPQAPELAGDHLVGCIDHLSRQTNLLALDALLSAAGDDTTSCAEAAHSARVLADRLAAGTRKTEARRSAG